MANEVQVEISIDDKQAIKALTKLKGKTKEYTDSAKKGSGEADSAFSKLAGTLKGNLAVAGVAVVGAAFAGMTAAMYKGIEAAKIQENAINALNNQLKLSGQFSKETSEGLQAFASELQRVTLHGDEAILGQLAFSQAMGASVEQSKAIVRAATDMSASLGMDLNSSVRNISKTLGGFAGELGETIPALKNLTKEQLMAGEGIKLLSEQFKGAGEGAVKTYGGATTQLGNAFGDLLEEVGKFVTKNETVVDAIKSTTKFIGLMGDAANSSRVALKDFFSNFSDAKTSSDIELIDEKIKDLGTAIEKSNRIATGNTEGLAEWWASQGRGAMDAAAQTKVYETRLSELQKRKADLIAAEAAGNNASPAGSGGGGAKGLSPNELAALEAKKEQELMFEQQKMIEIQELKDQFKVLEDERNFELAEMESLGNVETLEKLKEFENQKLMIKQEAELAKAALIKDTNKKNLEIERLGAKHSLENKTKSVADEKRIDALRITNRIQTAGTLSQIATNFASAMKKGSKEQAALQAAGAAINTYAGATAALAPPPLGGGPYLGPILAASIIASGLANVAQIKKQAFNSGGVVGGFSGATTGMDTTTASVRNGEMVLNANQQKRLFDIADNRESGENNGLIDAINRLVNMPTIVQVDGKEIARSVRNARLDGMTI